MGNVDEGTRQAVIWIPETRQVGRNELTITVKSSSGGKEVLIQ
jgi:hypothetical protein